MQQRIHINRIGADSIEFELDQIKVPIDPGEEVGFELIIINYGNPTRVNLSANDGIGDQINFLMDNPYVNEEERVPVIIKMPKEGGVYEGEIFITTAYGSKKKGFKVTLLMGREVHHKILVDEKLTKKVSHEPKQKTISKPMIRTHVPSLEVSYNQWSNLQWGIVIPSATLILILASIFLTFFIFEDKDHFIGSLFSSILIVFLIMYGLQKSIGLRGVK